MQEPPRPANEPDRLRALRQLLILDTPPEERFDRLTAFATQEFDVPTALLSLVDDDRQWFKSRVGMGQCETSRGISFCGHAILQDDIMVVPDVNLDERFTDNPLVTGEPHIRFYAGAPLRLPGGQNVGTLCLMDDKPRTLDAIDLAILASLRDLAVEELVRRQQGAPAS
jgi:GAF domain-containing protein